MRLINRFRFSTIAIISGAPKQDPYVSSITTTLQSLSKDKVNFVGVADASFRATFKKVYATSDLLDNQEF